jgi:hypothetical protein
VSLTYDAVSTDVSGTLEHVDSVLTVGTDASLHVTHY